MPTRPVLSALFAAALGCGCASLPEKPDPPHGYFAHPDNFVTIDDPALYPKPLKVRFKEAGAGPPMVLVHGLQTSSYSWRYVIDRFAAHHHVVALDLVGSGLSDHPRDFGYQPEHVAAFLEAFRAALEKRDPAFAKWDVVGNSLGGAYTAAYAASHPERVRKLVVIHAPGFMTEAPVWGLEQLRRGRVPEFASHLFGAWMVKDNLHYHRPGVISQEEVEQYALPYADAEGKAAFWHIVREGLSPEVATQLEPTLARITAPTLLIWATQDQLIPAWTGYRWEQAIPGSRLVWIPESSHFPQVEAPATTARLIDAFLADQPVQTALAQP